MWRGQTSISISSCEHIHTHIYNYVCILYSYYSASLSLYCTYLQEDVTEEEVLSVAAPPLADLLTPLDENTHQDTITCLFRWVDYWLSLYYYTDSFPNMWFTFLWRDYTDCISLFVSFSLTHTHSGMLCLLLPPQHSHPHYWYTSTHIT